MQRKKPYKHLFVIAIVALIVYQDNSGINQFHLREQIKSPYGVGLLERYGAKAENFLADNIQLPQARSGPLSAKNFQAAQTAWKYFANNMNEKTGLVNTIEGHQVTTLWDQASALSALYNARRMEIISIEEFDQRLNAMLHTLQSIELVDNKVPHKYYHTKTGKMVRYNGNQGRVGYSSIDIGRFLIWLKIIKEKYTEHAASVDKVALRWNYCSIVDNGQMFGGNYDRGGSLNVYQQGRLGYEEYAAKGFYLWGFNTSLAARSLPVKEVEVEGFDIPVDARDFLNPVEKSFVAADSYLLDGLEFNWDKPNDFHTDSTVHSDVFSAETSLKLYKAQQKRFEITGLPTAKSEYQLSEKPWFVYDTIYANGYAWNTINDLGTSIRNFSALTTKAGFAMWALWDTPYTDLLIKTVHSLNDVNRGYSEGVFEAGPVINVRSSNTNSMVLASLGYKAFGKPVVSDNHIGLWNFVLRSHLKKRSNERCFPLKHVCTENCEKIDAFSNKGVSQLKLKEIEAKLEKLESSRQTQLKAFETVQ